jgi:hypothetical protein
MPINYITQPAAIARGGRKAENFLDKSGKFPPSFDYNKDRTGAE